MCTSSPPSSLSTPLLCMASFTWSWSSYWFSSLLHVHIISALVCRRPCYAWHLTRAHFFRASQLLPPLSSEWREHIFMTFFFFFFLYPLAVIFYILHSCHPLILLSVHVILIYHQCNETHKCRKQYLGFLLFIIYWVWSKFRGFLLLTIILQQLGVHPWCAPRVTIEEDIHGIQRGACHRTR